MLCPDNEPYPEKYLYNVLLLAKHSGESHTIQVEAEDEDDALDVADMMIDEDDQYQNFRTGWKIAEANLA
jgi:hypothetical protein